MAPTQPPPRNEHIAESPVRSRLPTNVNLRKLTCRSPCLKSFLVVLFTLQLLFDLWIISPSALRYALPTFLIASETHVQQTQATTVAKNCSGDLQSGIPFDQSKYSSLTPSRVREILSNFNHRMTYIPATNTLFVTMAKAGSTTFWQTTYLGFTGKIWERKACGYIHNKSSPCWSSHLTDVLKLSTNEQFRLLYSNDTKRVAIQREPFSRLISGYKNKLMCGRVHFEGPDKYAENLRIQANLPPGNPCMNISEFAEVMDIIRNHVGQPGYMKSWNEIDKHFMPQNYYADEIFYHTVLDVEDLSNETKLAPFYDQLPHADLARNAGYHRVDTKSETIFLDDKSAQKLHHFARLAVTVPPQTPT